MGTFFFTSQYRFTIYVLSGYCFFSHYSVQCPFSYRFHWLPIHRVYIQNISFVKWKVDKHINKHAYRVLHLTHTITHNKLHGFIVDVVVDIATKIKDKLRIYLMGIFILPIQWVATNEPIIIYIHWNKIGSSLVQIITSRRFGSKPLSKAIFLIGPLETTLGEILNRIDSFSYSWKCIWNCRL